MNEKVDYLFPVDEYQPKTPVCDKIKYYEKIELVRLRLIQRL